jgi:4,5-DOPA dioxygenase extradiol
MGNLGWIPISWMRLGRPNAAIITKSFGQRRNEEIRSTDARGKKLMAITVLKSMPAIFIGHGNPMNTLQRNRWTEGWTTIGAALPRPKAILAVSAHWYIPATMVTTMPHPRTIHDFGGFPQELYEINYPAPGDPNLASHVQALLAPISVAGDEKWGLDHGTWSVLYHMFPEADIPVVQLSINRTKAPSFHYEIGGMLASLRQEGILILGSGNLVHNLQAYDWDRPDARTHDWALKFEENIRGLLQADENTSIVNYEGLGPEARLSVPTPDHYLPLLYVLGSHRKGERASFPIEGFDGGSMSMLAIQISE